MGCPLINVILSRNKSWEKEDPASDEAPPVKREPKRDDAHRTWRREGGQRRRDGETNNHYRYPHEEQAMFGRGGPHHFAAGGSPHHHHPYAGYHQYGAPMQSSRHYHADWPQDGGGYRYSSNHHSFNGHQGYGPHDGGADGWHGRRSGGWRGSSSRWPRGT